MIEENTSKKTKKKKFKSDNSDGTSAWADAATSLLKEAETDE
jgi:hypothetical protein